METFDLVKLLIEGGVAAILGTGLIVVWRTWRAERVEHEDEKSRIRKDYSTVIAQKNQVIEELSEQLTMVSQTANERMDRIVQMQADSAHGMQQVASESASAMATLQQSHQDLRSDIRELIRTRGGGA